MAAGDPITAARMAGLMRRTNALENENSYSATATNTVTDSKILLLKNRSITSDRTSKVFIAYDETGDTSIQSFDMDLTGKTEIISGGNGDGEIDDITGIDCNESGSLWVSDVVSGASPLDTRIQVFNISGSIQGSNEVDRETSPTRRFRYSDIATLSDGGCAVIKRTYSTIPSDSSLIQSELLTYNSTAGGETTILEVDAATTTNGVARTISGMAIDSDNNILVGVSIYPDVTLTEWRIYNTSGSLVDTITWMPTVSSSTPFYKYYSQEAYHVFNDNTLIYRVSGGIGFIYTDGYNTGRRLSISGSPSVGDFTSNDERDIYITYDVGGVNTCGRFALSGSQTTFKRYPNRDSTSGGVSLGTSDFGNSVPADSSLVGFRPHRAEINDVRAALETVATSDRKARIEEGSATSTNPDELIDFFGTFTDTVTVSDTVLNHTDRTTTTVLSIDSNSTLTLNADIMASGEEYSIQASAYTTTAGNKNIFSLAINNAQSDWTNTIVTGSRIRDTDYTDVSTVIDYLRRSTLQ
jgi:hypothetical protein